LEMKIQNNGMYVYKRRNLKVIVKDLTIDYDLY
jgi:hypothetical protein